MSLRYKGGIISATPPTTTGGTTGSGSASGEWTLQQQLQAISAGAWPLAGNYIEEVFSTYLYTGTGSTQTITNGIDLSGKGGMLWLKGRTGTGIDNYLTDTVRGKGNALVTNTTDANFDDTSNWATGGFNSTGFTIPGVSSTYFNQSPNTYVGWTFRKQPKFFDIVTYTGNGVAGRTVAHNLGSTPGCIIVKRTDSTANWAVYHRSLGGTQVLNLNNTNAASSISSPSTYWNNTDPTSTVFTVGDNLAVNLNGSTYVAYLFAHDAGNFGLTYTDNVISCGSFTTDSSGNATVNLGYEPQWLLIKRTDSSTSGNWLIVDSMRGWATSSTNNVTFINPNLSGGETTSSYPGWNPTSTGFSFGGYLGAAATYIYIAIRRGPMKTPTSGTSVYNGIVRTGTGAAATVTGVGFAPDLMIYGGRTSSNAQPNFCDRLRGRAAYVNSWNTSAESTGTSTQGITSFDMNGVSLGTTFQAINTNLYSEVDWFFKRAPGFFDEVCYTGDGTSPRTINHNLGVAPELIILKGRSATTGWPTGESFGTSSYGSLYLNDTSNESPSLYTDAWYFKSKPGTTSFSIGTGGDYNMNASGSTYVAYLFASVPGVSKVGTYSGTGATQTISCGFAARFVLIKRTDSTGNWWTWDTARGMVAGTDPRLVLNTTNAESNNNWVYTDASGFQIVTTDASVNANGGSYIYLAIA